MEKSEWNSRGPELVSSERILRWVYIPLELQLPNAGTNWVTTTGKWKLNCSIYNLLSAMFQTKPTYRLDRMPGDHSAVALLLCRRSLGIDIGPRGLVAGFGKVEVRIIVVHLYEGNGDHLGPVCSTFLWPIPCAGMPVGDIRSCSVRRKD